MHHKFHSIHASNALLKKNRLSPFLLLLTLFGFTNVTIAQSTIQGALTDENKQPIQKANVFLMRPNDSTQVRATITNETGTFTFFNVPEGSYFIRISAVEYEVATIPGFSIRGKSFIDLKTVQLVNKSRSLKEVMVEGRRPLYEQKIDRLVIHVKNNITSSGASALDILERAPGVVIDRQGNTVSMNGKGGVAIMINGKVSNMPSASVLQMLSGMTAGNIEKMELLSAPPSNYDAEGAAGFINIVLVQKASAGTTGTVALSAGYGRGETSSANVTFHHRKGDLYFFGDYSFSRIHQNQVWHNYRKVLFNGNTYENSSEADRDPIQRNHNVRLGIDYQLRKRTSFGGLVAAYNNRWSMGSENKVLYKTNEALDTLLSVETGEINRWNHLLANLHLQHQFKNGGRINTDIDQLYYDNDNPANYLNSFYDKNSTLLSSSEAQTRKRTPISISVIKSDYSHNLNKKLSFEAGFKHSLSLFQNDVAVSNFQHGQWRYDSLLTAVYQLRERVTGAYTTVAFNPNSKTEIKTGLRYEYTFSNLASQSQKNIVNRRYGNFFPSLFINRKLRADQNIALSYSRRINRPGFNDMAPFVIFLDRDTYFSGNPSLQPSTTDALKGDYSYKRFLFSFTFSREENAIAKWQSRVVEQTNKQFIAAENLKRVQTLSATISLPFNLTPWWSMQNSLIGMVQQVNASYKSPVQLTKNSFQLNSSQLFQVMNETSLEVSGFYRSKVLAGTYVMKPRGTLNMGIQRKVNQGKGVLSFTITDVFITNQWKSYIDLPEQNLVVKTDYLSSQRTFRLSYTLKIGKTELKTQTKRLTGSEEDQKRVN